jgi:hypothetical protein
MVAPKKKPRTVDAAPPPAKIDPVTGRTLSRGNPVPTAYSGSPADRSGLFQSSALGAARATFKPAYLGAKGRVPDTPPAPRAVSDPVSGLPLKKGNPVHTAYSGDMNSRVGLGLRTAGTAVGMAMKPNYLGAKGRVPNNTPAAIPPARAPQVPTVASVSRAKPNSPGYEDFPNSLAPGKKKRNGY